ncbi:MAG: cache domain-containing protein, partial [Phycisphaeraceae bacterium]|nr:cache domain-containing protein [Phycisphaeraceae bacterium]
MQLRLRTILTISFVALSSLPLLLGLVIVDPLMVKIEVEETADHFATMASVAESRLEAALDRATDQIRIAGHDPDFREALVQWQANPDSNHLVQIRRKLLGTLEASPALNAIYLFDPDGKPITGTADIPDAASLAIEEDSRPVTLLPAESSIKLRTHEPLVHGGKVIGHLVADGPAEFVWELVAENTGVSLSGEWLVAQRDADGHALFVSPLKKEPGAPFQRRVYKHQSRVPITQALQGNEEKFLEAPDYRNETVVAATRYLEDYDIGLVIKADRAEVLAGTNQIRW